LSGADGPRRLVAGIREQRAGAFKPDPSALCPSASVATVYRLHTLVDGIGALIAAHDIAQSERLAVPVSYAAAAQVVPV